MQASTSLRLGEPRDGARAVAAGLGVCVGISGLDHGFFEILQGNTATDGPFVHAIGPVQQMWVHGNEDAFTVVPNFLLTGVLAVVVGLAMIVWSVRFVGRPYGSRGFILLGLLMFSVGGGIGMLAFLIPGWAVARRIRRPAAWWGSVLPARLGESLARSRRVLVGCALVLYAFALEVAIVGFVPGVADPDLALHICWAALGGMLVMFALALFAVSTPDRVRVMTP